MFTERISESFEILYHRSSRRIFAKCLAIAFPMMLLSSSAGLANERFQLSEEFEEVIVETHTFEITAGSVLDGSPVGWADTRTIESAIHEITSIKVMFDVTTAFNGDLYAYLAHSSGFSILLNRPGRSDSNPFGYADQGFEVIFSDGPEYDDIHTYNDTAALDPGSKLNGTWQPDGRFVDPELVTDQSPRTALLSSFVGTNASDQWTLFVADMSGGSPTTINSWGLEITGLAVIPEPGTWTLILGTVSFVLLLFRGAAIRGRPGGNRLAGTKLP